MSGGGNLRVGEKWLPLGAADAVPWDSPLPALSAKPSSGSRVQVTRSGGGGPLVSAAWWAANPSAAPRRTDFGTPLLNSPAAEPPARGDYTWRGVRECVPEWRWRAF